MTGARRLHRRGLGQLLGHVMIGVVHQTRP